MTLAEYLARRRITQSRFANLIGVSRVSVSLWVNSRTIPRPPTLEEINRATGGAVTDADFGRKCRWQRET